MCSTCHFDERLFKDRLLITVCTEQLFVLLDNLDISSVEPNSVSFHQNLCNFDLLPRPHVHRFGIIC
jgi:hypothetical protein